MVAAKYTVYPVRGQFQNSMENGYQSVLSKVCLVEEKSVYDISVTMNWHSLPNSIMKSQRIILSSKNIPCEKAQNEGAS